MALLHQWVTFTQYIAHLRAVNMPFFVTLWYFCLIFRDISLIKISLLLFSFFTTSSQSSGKNNATCTVDFMIDSFNDGPPLSYACSLLTFSLICIFTIDVYQWARFCHAATKGHLRHSMASSRSSEVNHKNCKTSNWGYNEFCFKLLCCMIENQPTARTASRFFKWLWQPWHQVTSFGLIRISIN